MRSRRGNPLLDCGYIGVKEAVHAKESPLLFQECTDPPYDALKHQVGGSMGVVVVETV